MKSRRSLVWKLVLGMTLTVLPFAGGCLQGAASNTTATVLNAAPTNASVTVSNTVAETDDAAALAAAATNAPAIDISEAEIKPLMSEKPLVPAVSGSGPTGDLLKLAGSGVDENVILTYITNSPNIFNLTADEIIYLKDVGLSGAVVSAALQHDQELKRQGVTMQAPLAQPAETEIPYQSGATSNWIGQAQQPDASQVAPHPTAPYQAEGQPPAPVDGPQPAPAPAAPQVQVTYSTFYSSLAPYGTWVEAEGYGPVWQPTVVVVNRGWRPYFDGGRWMYTDHGWYWASDYSWGWAPFHYGRWFNHHRIGWCWTPDYVWGPAWVTWRYNDAYCGWAPLPPAAYYRPGFGFSYYGSHVGFSFGFGLSHYHYSFVHWNNFHNRHHHHHAVPHHESRDIYNRTRTVTRIVGNNNRIINEGISAQRVSAATRTEVRRVNLRETREAPTLGGRAERLDPAKRTLTVYKPEVPKNQKTEGGIPMERVRTASTRPARTGTQTATASLAPGAGGNGSSPALAGNRPARTRTDSAASAVERRDEASSSIARGPSRSIQAPVVGANPRLAENRINSAQIKRNSGGAITETASAVTPRVNGTPVPAGSGANAASPRRDISRSQLDAPRANSASSAPATATPAAPGQPERPARSQSQTFGANPGAATPASPNRSFNPPAGTTVPRATPAQPSPSASPRSTQTPSRIQRQGSIQQPNVSVPTPSSSAPAPRQFATPSLSQREMRTPQSSISSPNAVARSYTAPTPTPAPSISVQQRSFSASVPRREFNPPSVAAQVPQRSYSAPSMTPQMPQRSYSAPSAPPQMPQRSYSAPSAPPQMPQRSFSVPSAPPQMPQRSFNSPNAAPQRSFSAPSAPQQRSFSAPAPAPAPQRSAPESRSSGGNRGGSGGRER